MNYINLTKTNCKVTIEVKPFSTNDFHNQKQNIRAGLLRNKNDPFVFFYIIIFKPYDSFIM